MFCCAYLYCLWSLTEGGLVDCSNKIADPELPQALRLQAILVGTYIFADIGPLQDSPHA
jgi:hypothetical protein